MVLNKKPLQKKWFKYQKIDINDEIAEVDCEKIIKIFNLSSDVKKAAGIPARIQFIAQVKAIKIAPKN